MSAKIKKSRFLLTIMLVLICLSITSSFISYAEFRVINPFSTGISLIKVMLTDTNYVEVQKYPKVIIAKPNDAESNLVEYMKSKGFYEDKSGRMGALMRFENDITAQYILFSVNGYFSKWIWHE